MGSFFVPILNLYRPYQIMREIWRASDPATPLDMPYAWTEAPMTPLIGWWWGLWIGRSLTGSLATQALFMAATFLLIRLVQQIDERQEARLSLIRAAAASDSV